MRGLVDIITTISNSIRFIFMLFFLCVFGMGLIIVGSLSYAAPKAADSIERVSDRAVEAAKIDARNRSYAAEGWGYSDEPVD